MVVIIVIILTLVVLYVIGSAGLGWFPLLGACENAERINTVLLNLSYSFLASVLFFCMIELLPRWLNERKAFRVFEKDLKSVYRKMSQMVSVLKMMAGTESENEKLKIEDFSSLVVCEGRYRCSYVEEQIGQRAEQGVVDCYALLEHHSGFVLKKLHDILELPASSMFQQQLFGLLFEIKQNSLLSFYKHQIKTVSHHGSNSSIYGFDKKVYDFVQLYIRLSKHFKDNIVYHYSLINEAQCAEVKQQIIGLCSGLTHLNTEGFEEIHKNGFFISLYALPEEFIQLVASK